MRWLIMLAIVSLFSHPALAEWKVITETDDWKKTTTKYATQLSEDGLDKVIVMRSGATTGIMFQPPNDIARIVVTPKSGLFRVDGGEPDIVFHAAGPVFGGNLKEDEIYRGKTLYVRYDLLDGSKRTVSFNLDGSEKAIREAIGSPAP